MRINNKKLKPTISLIYSVAITIFLIGVFLYFIPIKSLNDKIPPEFMIIGALLIFIVMRFLGHQIFEYDSDGEALNFKSQDGFLSKYSSAFTKSSDFPKKKLISFKITGLIKKKLSLIITSKRSQAGVSKLTYNITFLNASEKSDLKRSLMRVVKQNRMMKQHSKPTENQEES